VLGLSSGDDEELPPKRRGIAGVLAGLLLVLAGAGISFALLAPGAFEDSVRRPLSRALGWPAAEPQPTSRPERAEPTPPLVAAAAPAAPAASRPAPAASAPQTRTGSVGVRTAPAGAVVYGGGRRLGPGPVQAILPAGEAELVAFARGMRPARAAVSVDPAAPSELELRLDPERGAEPPWREERGGPGRSGFAVGRLDPGSLALAFSVEIGGSLLGSPTIASGRAYVTGSRTLLSCVDLRTGKLLWQHQGAGGASASAVPGEKLVFLGTNAASLFGIALEKPKVEWQDSLHSGIEGAPLVLGERLVAADSSGNVVALSIRKGKNLKREWSASAGGPVRGSLAAEAGVLYAATDRELVALELASGRERFRAELGGAGGGSGPLRLAEERLPSPGPAAAGARVVIGTAGAQVHCLDAGGGQRWRRPVDGAVGAAAAIAYDTVYVGTAKGTLHALALEDGRERWRRGLGAALFGAPVVVDGTVLVGSDAGRLVALDAFDGSVLAELRAGGQLRASAAWSGSGLLASSTDGRLYAFGGKTAP
jgi:eukaryotic-like serine/threonine-protein kinase